MVCVGQGLLGKVKFTDGQMPSYPRTYLVISISSTQIGLLNVSSTAGKEHKLLYSTNRRLVHYNPPFLKDSFVKLDSLVYVAASEIDNFKILHNGECLASGELNEIVRLVLGKTHLPPGD